MLTFFNNGYTIAIKLGNSSIAKLIIFCNVLENELKIHLDANIYITPCRAQGFSRHYDDHDVFILQIYGTKTWRLYDTPIHLPCKKQSYGNRANTVNPTNVVDSNAPQFEDELKPGDLLYIPRGLVHEAATTDTASIHITLGLHPNYWFELLQGVVEIAQDMPEFRRAVPNGLMSQQEIQCFKEQFRNLSQTLIGKMDVDKLLERASDKYILQSSGDYGGYFKDFIQLHRVILETILSRRENIIVKIDQDDEYICIRFHGKTLQFPLLSFSSIRTLLQPASFKVGDIGGLITDEGKINLATEFIRKGFLKIQDIKC